jgi:hypothetical protein
VARWQGHTTFAKLWQRAREQFLRPQVFSQVFLFFKKVLKKASLFTLICRAKALCGKEASLLT